LTITRYRWQPDLLAISSEHSDEILITILDGAILDALDKQPFSSLQEFAKLTYIPKTAVCRHSACSLGFVVRYLRWVPHELTMIQKGQRVGLSNQLLREFRSIKHQDWQFILTLDESWFSFATDHE
jgi:hypothetical protein